jgi:general secretion pathway protein I
VSCPTRPYSRRFALFADSRRGFSLIEVLAALAIFGLSIGGLIQGIAMALAQWSVAEDQTKALMLAENVMEEIIYNADLTPGEEGEPYEPPDDRFAWESVIEETDVPGLVRIEVRVAWTSRGQERDVVLTTLKAESRSAPGAGEA